MKKIKFLLLILCSLIAIIICFFTFFQITANAQNQYEIITNSEGEIEHIKENYTDGVVEFKLNIELDVERNTGIGNDFRAKYYVNGEEVSDGDILLLDTSENVELSYDVYEKDEHSDEGSGYDKVHIYSYKETAIRVHAELEEYMGRKNQGAEATIGAIFTFTPLIEEQTTEEHTETTQTEQQPNKSLLVTIIGYILRISIATLVFGSAILLIYLLFTFKKDSDDKILLKGYSSGLFCSVLNTIREDYFNNDNYLWVILLLILVFGIFFAYQTRKKTK